VVNTAFYGSKHRAVKKAIDSLIKKGITVVGIAGRVGQLHLNISVVLDTLDMIILFTVIIIIDRSVFHYR